MPLGPLKLQSRLRLIRASVRETAALFSREFQQNHNIPNAVAVTGNPALLEGIVAAYDREVDRFKAFHGYGPGDRINSAKIAALLVRVMVRDGIDGIFIIADPRLAGRGIDFSVGVYFVWHVVCAILAIQQGKLPENFRRDFQAAILECNDPSPELLCLTMAAIRTAFGDSTVNPED